MGTWASGGPRRVHGSDPASQTTATSAPGNFERKVDSVQDVFTLAHLSDLHITDPANVRPGQLLGKRLLSWLSWRIRRGSEHLPEVFEAARVDLRRAEPQQVVVTGDITCLGLPCEYRQAVPLFEELGPQGHVLVVPGNHDVQGRRRGDPALDLWLPWLFPGGRPDPSEKGIASSFPSLTVKNTFAFIGLCTARPKPPFLATGTLGRRQIAALRRVLAECRNRGLVRIVAMHHPPDPHLLARRKRLTDGHDLLEVLRDEGAELILHGHAHHPSETHVQGPGGPIPVLGAPSATDIGLRPSRRARFNLLRLLRRGGHLEIEIEVRGYDPRTRSFRHESRRRLLGD